ncbi:MAG: hypothetical protein KC766_11100 [Myxococcales bacterium]|nr:hypothetical protein [Myxococcales bacterium]
MNLSRLSPSDFRRALLALPAMERDAWLSTALGLREIPDDSQLPRGCVPYLPAPVDALLGAVDDVPITETDVVVDVGSGVGRAAAAIQLLSGAHVMCVELQPQLLGVSRALFERLESARVTHVDGDAVEQASRLEAATVFFLYCPFSGERLSRFLEAVRPLADRRRLRFACVDVPLPEADWLEPRGSAAGSLQIYDSR